MSAMPIAVLVLIALAFALSVLRPDHRDLDDRDRRRWWPGAR
jgi:hypothetical protein